jgi:cytochrome c oxidase cbb3-type subunit 2
MPSFKWLDEAVLTGEYTGKKLATFNTLTKGKTHKDANGNYIPLYTEEEIAGAQAAVEGKTEMQALIAYLQQLGTHLK